MAGNPFEWFKQGRFGQGGEIDPFSALRGELGQRLFRQSGIFGQQTGGALSAQGRYDPNLVEAMRLRALGSAQDTLSSALASLSGQEAQFREGQRQFNLGLQMQGTQGAAEWAAAQPNALDWITGIGSLGLGLGSFGAAGGFKGMGWLLNLFKGSGNSLNG